MGHQNTVFHTLLGNLPWGRFGAIVDRHQADKGVRRLSTRTQLTALLYGQLASSPSLRGLVSGFASHHRRLYHLGAETVSRSTLSDANRIRPAAVFAELFAHLVGQAHPSLARKMRDSVLLIDSTTLRLNRRSGDWSRFSHDLHGAKAHIVYDPDADCPIHAVITPERVNDITAAKTMPIQHGATYVFDLGYTDYRWWAQLDDADCRIVTRLKVNVPLHDIGERLVRPGSGILSDCTGTLPARQASSRHNPMHKRVREVRVKAETGTILRLVTNDLSSPPEVIAELYKRRWAIELFFRWVKQVLKLRQFIGTSENAVRIQIAVALIAFLLLRLAHHAVGATHGALTFARLVIANLMHRRTLRDLLGMPDDIPKSHSQQGVLI